MSMAVQNAATRWWRWLDRSPLAPDRWAPHIGAASRPRRPAKRCSAPTPAALRVIVP